LRAVLSELGRELGYGCFQLLYFAIEHRLFLEALDRGCRDLISIGVDDLRG
jgi:hypothetical protein